MAAIVREPETETEGDVAVRACAIRNICVEFRPERHTMSFSSGLQRGGFDSNNLGGNSTYMPPPNSSAGAPPYGSLRGGYQTGLEGPPLPAGGRTYNGRNSGPLSRGYHNGGRMSGPPSSSSNLIQHQQQQQQQQLQQQQQALGGGVEANPNLYVHNVPKDSNEEELRVLFGRFGTVERVRLKVNQKVGPHAVYAFVTFSSTSEAQLALNNLQGTDIRGRALRIEFQRTTTASSPARTLAPSPYEAPSTPSSEPQQLRTPAAASSNSSSTTAAASPYKTESGDNNHPDLPAAMSFQARPPGGGDNIIGGGGGDTPAPPGGVAAGSAGYPDPLARNAPESSNWGAVQDWGGSAASPVAGMGGRPFPPAHSRDSTNDYMPPQKRGRFHSPANRPADAAAGGPGTGGAAATDSSPSRQQLPPNAAEVAALLNTLKSIVSATHPEASGLVSSLSELLLSGASSTELMMGKGGSLPPAATESSMWPQSELTPPLQQLARSGTLTLDPVSNRWNVSLSPILESMKPGLFSRRVSMPPPKASQRPMMVEQQHNIMGGGGFGGRQPPPARPEAPHIIQPATNMWSQQPTPPNFRAPQAPPPMYQTAVEPPPAQQPELMPDSALTHPPVSPLQPAPPVGGVYEYGRMVTAEQPAPPLLDEPTTTAQWTSRLSNLEVCKPEDRAVVWNGILARNEKKKMPVVMKRLAGTIDNFLPPKGSTLNISHRSALEEMFKKQLGGIGLLEASTPESAKTFQEYICYFQEKNRAGVVRLERAFYYEIVYLIPIGVPGVADALGSMLSSCPPDCLLAIVGRTVGGLTPAEDGGVADQQDEAGELGVAETRPTPPQEKVDVSSRD